ncbi:MAG: hypothetical protein K0R12_7 [Gammaproteobacteria bacterium]|nr:hypothetical protein [Gammaproteobacteria bacterium]
MKKHVARGLGSFLLCLLLSQAALAGFYVVDETSPLPKTTTPSSSAKPPVAKKPPAASPKAAAPPAAAAAKKSTAPNKPAAPAIQTYAIYPGSLKSNVERIVRQAHWGDVVWTLPYDYRWVGTSTMKSDSVQEAVDKLLANYPLQAIFYEQNHIVEIKPRPTIAYHAPEALGASNDQPGALNARSSPQEGKNE